MLDFLDDQLELDRANRCATLREIRPVSHAAASLVDIGPRLCGVEDVVRYRLDEEVAPFGSRLARAADGAGSKIASASARATTPSGQTARPQAQHVLGREGRATFSAEEKSEKEKVMGPPAWLSSCARALARNG